MKIKTLLITLCLLCGLQTTTYCQQSEESSRFHKAPPRKEIRHLVSTDGSHAEEYNPLLRASGEYIMDEFPTMGEIKGVVILAEFSDIHFTDSVIINTIDSVGIITTDTVSIDTLLSNRYNADNYSEQVSFNEYSEAWQQYCPLDAVIPGSARDYFRTQSFGQFVPSFDVIGPVTLSHDRAYYGANNSSGSDKNTSGMIREACLKAYSDSLTDFTDYDNDGDGVVDFVYVVYAGSDEAQTGIEECIWAKASSISLTLGNGMKIKRYACSGELVIDLPVVAGIGTFVHEFSHVLGLPDFYNTQTEDFTMDVWSVMDYGMYNAEGFVPCAYTAFERYSLGWIPMETLDKPATMEIGTTDVERKGYRIFTADIDEESLITEADTASFYVLETIRREGWNRYAAASGLLVSEVTYSKTAWEDNDVNIETNHRHCIVPANNDYNYKTANKHLFGNDNHEFTLNSTPASITQFGATMDKPLTDIRYDTNTGKTSFHFCGGNLVDGLDETPNQTSGIRNSYDLQGRFVKCPEKGVHIQNGKKYLAF